MDAVILAGGFGTRLRPWTDTVPKPLIPLLDMTLIEHTIRILPRNTIQRVIIASGYGVDQMRAYFDNFDAGFEVIVVEEDQPLGTGGAIANCREHIRGPRAIVMNGDLITTVDVEEMLSQHVESNALISISLWPVEDPTRFGVADFDHNKGLIRRFQEKPRLEEAYSNLINAGCYIVERSVIQGLSTEYHSMERDVFPGVAESGRMGGYRYSGRFIDAGTPKSYLEAMVAAIEDNSFNTGGIVGTSWYADPKMSKKGI
ncbi:MAG: nucleotidyltransferase family protein, partial [Candidatus Thermoplasmatota archaeon]|nr:nucleotidyltransferase family protein [Candidatus Thermoplasmatota archaeon]